MGKMQDYDMYLNENIFEKSNAKHSRVNSRNNSLDLSNNIHTQEFDINSKG